MCWDLDIDASKCIFVETKVHWFEVHWRVVQYFCTSLWNKQVLDLVIRPINKKKYNQAGVVFFWCIFSLLLLSKLKMQYWMTLAWRWWCPFQKLQSKAGFQSRKGTKNIEYHLNTFSSRQGVWKKKGDDMACAFRSSWISVKEVHKWLEERLVSKTNVFHTIFPRASEIETYFLGGNLRVHRDKL